MSSEEDRATAIGIENFVKFGHVLRYVSGQTHRQTYRHAHAILRIPTGGEVIIQI